MSRIGKLPVELPKEVKATIAGQLLKVEGPKGKLEREIRPEISIKMVDNTIVVERLNETKQARAFHGMERSLVNNMVVGVSQGYSKELSLIGTGYRADLNKNTFNLALGYSHTIDFPLPEGVIGSVIKENRDTFIKLESANKQLVGQVAAQIRELRPPEPYKGKGVRYRDEVVKIKAGKAGKSGKK
jgi:large subunit ribosomal protein L6